MFKRMLAFLIVGTFSLILSRVSFAQGCGLHGRDQQIAQAEHNSHTYAEAETAAQAVSKEVVNVGNKICPVLGEKVGENGMEPATYEYEGKIYNFCCTACIDEFKKDPAKYIKKIEEEKKGLEIKMQPESQQGHRAL
ncbi:MAG: YHS domain-containing protein [Candidatus Omnitrophota bacterium]